MESVSPTPTQTRSRKKVIGSIVAGLLAVSVLAGCLSQDQVTVQNQVNASRSANGVARLADYQPADSKAQAWANYLASIGTIQHSNLTSGYQSGTWCGLAENVGMGPNLAGLQTAFMNSPSHRANILNASYDHIGTGVAYKNGYYYVVHEFVNRC